MSLTPNKTIQDLTDFINHKLRFGQQCVPASNSEHSDFSEDAELDDLRNKPKNAITYGEFSNKNESDQGHNSVPKERL